MSSRVLRTKTDDEIDTNIKEQQLKTQRKAQEIVKELEGLIKERTQALIDGKIDPSLLEEATKKASLEEETDEADSKEETNQNESKAENKEEAENSDKEPSKESENAVS